jgi:hypothetical protein
MLVRLLLSLIAAVLVLALGTAAYLFVFANGTGRGPLNIQLGSVRLVLSSEYVRNPDHRISGEFSELEIAANTNDFRPATRPDKLRPGMDDASEGIVYISLRAQEKSLDPAERPARLYVRFLEQDEWSHPGGLVMRRFEEGSPFGREDLYMAPPEGRVFAARCTRPMQPPDGLPNTCLSEMRFNGLDVRLRFSPNHLGDWERLVAGVRGLVNSMMK